MTTLELMERIGYLENPNKVLAYVQDAFDEIETLCEETISRELLDIEADTRYYNLPTTAINVLGVYRKFNDDNQYIRIPEILNPDVIDQASESTASSEDDIIVV